MNLQSMFSSPVIETRSKKDVAQSKKALLWQEMQPMSKFDPCYAGSDDDDYDIEDDVDKPHYEQFLQRTNRLNVDEDTISLDNGSSSNNDEGGQLEIIDDNIILNDIIDELNSSYSDREDDAGIPEFYDESTMSSIVQTPPDSPALHSFLSPMRQRKINEDVPKVKLLDTLKMIKKDCNRESAIIVGFIIVVPLIIALLMIVDRQDIIEIFQSFYEWFDKNPTKGFFAFSSIYYIWVPLALPSSIMTLLGGFIFSMKYGGPCGFFIAMLAIWLSHPAAALMTFCIGRYFLQDYIRKHMIDKIRVIKAMDKAFEIQGMKLAILLRIQPILPWNVLNYIIPMTSCSAYEFFIGTCIGITPGTFTFLYVGVNLHSLSQIIGGQRLLTGAEVVFLLFSCSTVFLPVYIITKEAKKELKKILNQDVELQYSPKSQFKNQQIIDLNDYEGGLMIIEQ